MPPKRRRPYAGTPQRRRVRRRLFYGRSKLFAGKPLFARYSRSHATSRKRRSRFKPRLTRRRRFRRRSLRSKNTFAMRVVNALTSPQFFTMEYGQEHTVPAASATSGTPCQYFTTEQTAAGNPGVDKSNIGTVPLFHYSHLRKILSNIWNTSVINLAPGTDGVWNTSSFRTKILLGGQAVYTLRNQSNETEHLEAYYCKARKDIATDLTTTGVYNFYQYLSHGFFNNKIATNSSGTNNTALYSDQFTPFQSFDFCRYFKIYKVKKFRIEPSESSIHKVSSRSRMYSPIDWFWLQNETATWTDVPQSWEYVKPSKFIMFKLKARPAGAGEQPNPTKSITMTTPTVIMDTKFRYKCKIVQHPALRMGQTDNYGITAAAAPAIIVPDGNVVGEEKEAP